MHSQVFLARIIFFQVPLCVFQGVLFYLNLTKPLCQISQSRNLESLVETHRLETKEQRHYIRLRIDGGFGTDENINYALWRGYEVLAKIYSGNRAKALARSVAEWVDVPTQTQQANNQPATRQAGWVASPHCYARKTRQVAIHTPNPKRKGGYSYIVLVTTDMNADLATILQEYDAREGVMESSFCQDNQGLGQRKRRKRKFSAQQMVNLLSQLAHNLIQWLKHWIIQALEQRQQMEEMAAQMVASQELHCEQTGEANSFKSEIQMVIQSIKERGIKRFVRQIFSLSWL